MVLSSCEIPVIDLSEADLSGQGRTNTIQQICKACEEHGMFQIINHGATQEVTKNMIKVAKEFFEMPFDDRAQHYHDRVPQKPVTVAGRLINDKESVTPWLVWLEFLGHPCHPLEDVMNSWPEKPEKYREIAGRYALELRSLGLKLLGLLSEGLGLETCYIDEKFGKQDQQLRINYYPPCPDPSVKIAIHGHTDTSGITILLQEEIPGLELMTNGKWVNVEVIPNAFVVNLGDHLEAISNGRFKSAKHRAITNSSRTRISIATFYLPSLEAFIAPEECLLNEDNPAHYRGYNVGEFLNVYLTKDLTKEMVLDHYRI